MGILQARILEWVAMPSSRGSAQPRDQTQASHIAGRFFYQLSHHGSPRTLEWVAYPFSRGSSSPRNQTRAFCTAGGFFTSWATREALFLFFFFFKCLFFVSCNTVSNLWGLFSCVCFVKCLHECWSLFIEFCALLDISFFPKFQWFFLLCSCLCLKTPLLSVDPGSDFVS